MSEITAERRIAPLSTKNKVGLVLAAVLGLSDALSVLAPTDSDQPGPPFVVLAVDAVLGIITLAAVVYTWRTANRIGARIVAGTRILSALSALPAFLVGGVPAFVVVIAASGIIITAITIALVLARPKTS
jgi:hypothetical protein